MAHRIRAETLTSPAVDAGSERGARNIGTSRRREVDHANFCDGVARADGGVFLTLSNIGAERSWARYDRHVRLASRILAKRRRRQAISVGAAATSVRSDITLAVRAAPTRDGRRAGDIRTQRLIGVDRATVRS